MPQTRRSYAEELERSRKLDKSTGLSPGREGKSILKPCRQRMPLQEVSDLQFNGDKDGDANELCRNSSRRVSFAVSEVKEFVQPVNEGTLWGNLYVYDIQKSSSESEATTPSCSDLPNVSSASYKSGFVMSQEIVVEETVSVSYSQDVSEDKRQEILHQNHGVRRNLFVDRGNQTDESSFHILGESHNEHQGKCHCNTREFQERNCIEDFVCSYALRSRKSTKLCDEYINNTCSNSHVYQLKRKHSPSQNSDHGDGDDKDDRKASFGVDHKVKKQRRHKNKGYKCGPNSLQNQPSKEENKQVDPTNTESRHFPDCHVIRNECFKTVECNATSSSDSEGDAYRGSLAQNTTSFCNREMRDEKNCDMFCQSPSKIDCSGSSMETDSFLSYSIKEENLHCKEENRTKSHVEPTENILNGSQDEDMSFTLAEGLVLSDLSEGKSSICTGDKKVDFVDQGKIHSEVREQNTSHTQYFNENVNKTTNIQSCSDNVSVCASPTLAVGKILGSINQEFRSSNAGFSPTIAVGQIFKIETEKSHEIKGILSPISIDKKIILNDSIKSYKVEDKGMCPSFGDSNTANENMELTSADISDDTSSITRGVIFSENHCSENNHFIHSMINSPTKNCEVSTPSSMFRSIFNPKTMFMCNTFQKYKETEEHNCSTYMSDDDDDSKPCIKNCGSGTEGKSECNTIDNISKPALIKEDSVCNDLQDTSKRKSEYSEPSNHPDEVLSVRESPKHLLATTVNHSDGNFLDSEQCMQFNISERSVSPIVAAGKIFGPANASKKFSNNVSELITSAESDDKCSKSEESMQMDNSEGSLSPTTADGKIFSSVSGLMNIIDSSKTRISKKLCENICSKSEQFVLMGTSGRCVSPTIAAGKIISSESRSDENIINYPRQTICANVTENVLSKSEKGEGNISMCNVSHTIAAGKILSSDLIQKIGFVNSSILSTSALLPEDLLPSKFEKPMDMDNSAGRNVSHTMAAGKIFTAENGQDGVNSFIQTTSAKFSENTLPSRFEKPMEMDISGRNLSPTMAAGKIFTSEIGKEYDLVNSSMLSENAEFSTNTLSSRFEKPVQMDISGRSVSPTMASGRIFTSDNGKENDLNPSIQTKSSICSVNTLPSRFEKPMEMNVSSRNVSPTLAAGQILTSENGEENDLNPSLQTKSSICSVHTLPSRFEKPMEMNVSCRSVSPTLAAGKILTSENGKENDLNPSIQTKSSICYVNTLPSRFEKPMEMNVSGRSVSPTLAAGKILTSENGEENDLNPSIQTKSSICYVNTLPSRFEKPMEMNVSGRSVSPTLAAGQILTSENGEENYLNPSLQTKSSICSIHTLPSRFEKPMEMNVSCRSVSPTLAAGKILTSENGKENDLNPSLQTKSSICSVNTLPSRFEKPMEMNVSCRSVSPTLAAGKILTSENGKENDLNPSIQTKSSICSVNTLPSRFEKPMEMNVSCRSVSPTLAAGKILTSENGEENDFNPSIQTKSSICSVNTLPSRFEKPMEMNVSGRSVSPTLAAGKILTSENGKENDLNPSLQTKSSICSVHTLPSRFEKPMEMNVSGRNVSPTLAAGKILTSENGEENDLNPSIQTKSSICSVNTLPSRFEKPMEMNVSGRSVSPTLAAGKILTSENGKENDLNPSIQTKSSICSVNTLPSRFEKPMEMNVSGRSVFPTLAAGKILTIENGEENDLNSSVQTTNSKFSVNTLSSRFEKPLEMNVSGWSISPTIAAGKLLLENKGDLVNFPEQTNSLKLTKDIYSLDSEKNMQMDLLDKSVSPTMAAGKVLTLENERKDDLVNSSQVTAGAQKLPRATKGKVGMDITEETSSIMSIRNECSKNVHGETFKGKYDSHNQIDNFVRNVCSNNSGTVEHPVNECNKQTSEDLLECRLGNIESSHLLSEKVMKKNITSESVSPTVSGGKVSLDSNIKQNSMACEKLFLNCKVSSDLENSLQKDEGDGICSPTLALGRVFNATNRQLEKANFTEFQGQSILTSSETNNLSSKQKLCTTESISREEVLPDEVVGVNSRKVENTDSKLSLNLQSSALKDKQNNEFHCAANSGVSNFGNDFSESNFCISQNQASANPEATNGRVQDIPDNTLINNSELTRLSPEQNVIDEVFHSKPSLNCRVMNVEKCSRVTEVNKRADNEQEMETTSDMSDFVPLNPSVTCERIDYDIKIDCNDVGNSDVPSPARYYKSSEVNITNGNVLIGTGKEKRHCEEELSNCTNWSENCDGYLGQEKKKYKTTNISPLPHFTKVPLINSPINYINLKKSIDVDYVMETDDEIDSEKNIPDTNTHSTSVSQLPLTDTDIGRNSVTSEKNSSESSNSLIDVSKLSENDGDISVMDCIRSMREKDLEDRENESRRSIVMSPSHNVSSVNRKSFQANSFQKPEFKQSFHGSRKDTKEILVSPLPNKKLKYFGNANKGDVFDEINHENHEETQKSRSQINLFDTEIGRPYSQNNNSMELQESVFSSPTSRKCDNVVSSIALVEIKCDVAEENLNNLSTNLQTPSTDAYLESKKVLSPSSQIFNESKTSEEKLYGKTHTNEFPNNSTQNDHLGADLENARFSSPNLNSVCKSNMISVSQEIVRETTEPITYVQEFPARNIDEEEKNNSLKYSNKSSVSSGTTLRNSVTTFSGSPCSVELWIEEHQKRFDCAWTFVSSTNTTMNFYFIERQLHILIKIYPCDCSINILTYSNISGNKMKLLMNGFMMRKLDPKYLEQHFRKKNDIPSLITYVTQQIDFFFDFFQDWLHLLIQHNIQIDSNLRVTFKVFSLVLSWCCKVSVDFSDWDGGRRQMKHITVVREVGEASTDDIRKLIRGVPAGPHILKEYIKHIHDYINIKESLEGHVD